MSGGRSPRLPDWRKRLMVYLEKCRLEPWGWGQADRDCALFACGAVEAQTGWHPMPWLIGRYHDEAGAMREIRAAGGPVGTLEAATTLTLGSPLENKNMAQQGYVALAADVLGRERLCVHVGDRLVAKCEPVGPEGGVTLLRPERAVIVWPVG